MNWKVAIWLAISGLCLFVIWAFLFALGMSTPAPDRPPGTWGVFVAGKEVFIPAGIVLVFSLVMAAVSWRREPD